MAKAWFPAFAGTLDPGLRRDKLCDLATRSGKIGDCDQNYFTL